MIVCPRQFASLRMIPYVSGYIDNNTYALYDEETKDCVIIDPSFHFERVLADLTHYDVNLREIWLTHGHFDHIIGCALPEAASLPSRLHPLDLPLFRAGGEATGSLKREVQSAPLPSYELHDGELLKVGNYEFKVLLTPGHTPGHCCFYNAEAGWLFSGDLVFFQSYGRTDFTGGSQQALMRSIREKILTLPDETLIFPGHEEYTRVKDERWLYS